MKILIILLLFLINLNLILTTPQKTVGLGTFLGRSSPINFNLPQFDITYPIPIMRSIGSSKIIALNFDVNIIIGSDSEVPIRLGYALALVRNGELLSSFQLNFEQFNPAIINQENKDFFTPNKRLIYGQFRTLDYSINNIKVKTGKLIYPMPISMESGDSIYLFVKGRKVIDNKKININNFKIKKLTELIKKNINKNKNNNNLKLLRYKRLLKRLIEKSKNETELENELEKKLEKKINNEFAYVTGYVSFMTDSGKSQYINPDTLEKIY
jgi:hypothetical protein